MTELQIHLDIEGESDEAIDRTVEVLRTEILCIDGVVDATKITDSNTPAGTRSVALEQLGALLVVGKTAVDIIGPVLDQIRYWRRADSKSRSATLIIDGNEISLSGHSAEIEEKLVDAWLSNVKAGL